MLGAIGHLITVYEGGSITASATRTGDLYKGKL
jgi:hypothetical protein